MTNQEQTKKLLPLLGVALALLIVTANVCTYVEIKLLTSANNSPIAIFHRQFGFTSIIGGNYSFSPPITKYEAINIALGSDNWTQRDLQNKTMYVSLDRVVYYNDSRALSELASKENLTLKGQPNPDLNLNFSGFENLGKIDAPVDSYQPIVNEGVSLRYVWTIVIQKDEGVTIPPYGFYMVDAATGELVPFPGHLF